MMHESISQCTKYPVELVYISPRENQISINSIPKGKETLNPSKPEWDETNTRTTLWNGLGVVGLIFTAAIVIYLFEIRRIRKNELKNS